MRRLEQRLVEATSTEGDWRLALFRNPRTLLQPLEATGAALFHDGEMLTSGEVPSTPELRALLRLGRQRSTGDAPFSLLVGRREPTRRSQSLTPTASGVLAVRLSAARPDYLMWFRKEQLHTVTWAGDPTKPMVGNDPLELSPRRSFAAWSEIVRGTALPWTQRRAGAGARHRRGAGRHHRAGQCGAPADRRAPARAGARHRGRARTSRWSSPTPPAALLFANDAFCRAGRARAAARRRTLDGAAGAVHASPSTCAQMLAPGARRAARVARRTGAARGPAAAPLPVAVRAEPVPGARRRGAGLHPHARPTCTESTRAPTRRASTSKRRCRAPAWRPAGAADGRRRDRRHPGQRQPGGDGHRRRRRRPRGGAAAARRWKPPPRAPPLLYGRIRGFGKPPG